MANFAHLSGCPDRGAAQRYDFKAIWAAPGPELTSRYSIPLFWLAGFDRTDEVLTQWPPPGAKGADGSSDESSELVVLCAACNDFSARLERRRVAILALLPAPMALYFDEWQRFVRARYTQHLLLRTEDIFGMQGFDESVVRLRLALDALTPADSGKAIRDSGVIDWFASYTTLFAERLHGEVAADAAAAAGARPGRRVAGSRGIRAGRQRGRTDGRDAALPGYRQRTQRLDGGSGRAAPGPWRLFQPAAGPFRAPVSRHCPGLNVDGAVRALKSAIIRRA